MDPRLIRGRRTSDSTYRTGLLDTQHKGGRDLPARRAAQQVSSTTHPLTIPPHVLRHKQAVARRQQVQKRQEARRLADQLYTRIYGSNVQSNPRMAQRAAQREERIKQEWTDWIVANPQATAKWLSAQKVEGNIGHIGHTSDIPWVAALQEKAEPGTTAPLYDWPVATVATAERVVRGETGIKDAPREITAGKTFNTGNTAFDTILTAILDPLNLIPGAGAAKGAGKAAQRAERALNAEAVRYFIGDLDIHHIDAGTLFPEGPLVPSGHIRLYRGTARPETSAESWTFYSPSYEISATYSAGGQVQAIDVPASDIMQRGLQVPYDDLPHAHNYGIGTIDPSMQAEKEALYRSMNEGVLPDWVWSDKTQQWNYEFVPITPEAVSRINLIQTIPSGDLENLRMSDWIGNPIAPEGIANIFARMPIPQDVVQQVMNATSREERLRLMEKAIRTYGNIIEDIPLQRGSPPYRRD